MHRLSGARNSNFGTTGERRSRGRSVEGRTSLLQPGFALKNRRSSSEARDSLINIGPRKSQLSVHRSRSQQSIPLAAATPRNETRSPSQSNSRSTTPSDGRFSGIAGIGSNTKTRRDVRNFADKKELTAAIVRVTNYFSRHTMSLNFRQPLMLKTFVDLFNFLLSKLDGQTTASTSNYVEEIPFVMRNLGYPGSLAPSWLKSANTQHAFPHVMALLSWLVDLVEEMETLHDAEIFAQGTDPDEGDFKGAPPNEYLDYFILSYAKWNFFESEAEAAMTDQFLQKLVAANLPGADESKMENLEKEIDTLSAKCSVNHGNVEKKKEYEEALSRLQSDFEKLTKHKKLSENYQKDVDERIEILESKILETEGKIVNIQNHTDQLRQQVAKQEMSLEERDEIVQICEQLKERLKSKEKCISELQEIAFQEDRTLASTRTKFNKYLDAYNKFLVVESCSLPELSQLQIQSNAIHESFVDETLEVDKMIELLGKKFCEERAEVLATLAEITAKVDEMKESLSVTTQETAKENSRIQQIECDIASFKIAMKEEEAKFREEEKQLQADLELQANDEKLAALKERVTFLKTRCEKWHLHVQQLKEKAARFFEQNTLITREYCAAVQIIRREAEDRLQKLIKKRSQET